MVRTEEELVVKLRGSKVPFFLTDAETRLDSSDYPFPDGKAPVQCRLVGVELEKLEAYTSGNRSIILPHGKGWFKAKAIGIPHGVSQPILKEGRLHSYFLTSDRIGSGTLIWGFSTVEEAESEFRWMERIHDVAPSPKPVGVAFFRNLSVKEFKDRIELFDYLNSVDMKRLLEGFEKNGRLIDAASVYSLQPTDIRVDEVLYGFISPELERTVDLKDCKDYLKWLGSSCGRNLRLLHDSNILHGSILRYGGVMTNSHVANHLVNKDATWITDFHMSQETDDDRLKMVELECLTHVMNPLESAEKIGRSRFKPTPPLATHVFSEFPPSSYIFHSLEEYRPSSAGEQLAEAFIDGVEYGYFRRKVIHVEATVRRELLEKAVNLKHELWKTLNLPDGMQRGDTVVRELMSRKKSQASNAV